MAESKFLKYQDKTGDGLIDVCDEVIDVPEPPCEESPCMPNASTMVPNWHVHPSGEPFLNGKNCLYQVPIETTYTTTIDKGLLEDATLTDEDATEDLQRRYDNHKDKAVDAFIAAYNKDDSEASKKTVKDAITWDIETDYYLPSRPLSRLRLLYSVLYEVINNLESAEPESEDEDDGEDDSVFEATYLMDELKSKLIHIRKGLKLYSFYNKMLVKLEGENLYYSGEPFEGLFFPLDNYGDWGVIKGSIMAKLLPQLDKFLNSKGYNIGGVGSFGGFTKNKVKKITFNFSDKYELTKMTVYGEGCPEDPILFKDRLTTLIDTQDSVWGDPTALSYLAKLTDMEADLTAREPIPWLEFIKKHTYPAIYSQANQGYTNTDPEESSGSCIAGALAEEGKQLGEDILDEAFSIGDAIAYQFNKYICTDSADNLIENFKKLKLVYDPDTDEDTELRAAAKEQAFQTLDDEDQSFNLLCDISVDSLDSFNDLWTQSFDKLEFCGLADLMLESISCLMGGLSFEASMAAILESALRAMSLENMDKLFVGLPPEKQAELNALLQKKLENGEFFQESSTLQQLSDSIEGKLDIEKLWTPERIEEQNENYMQEDGGGTTVPTGIPTTTDPTKRTLGQQLDLGASAKGKLSPNVLAEAWVLAYLEVYSDSYLDLLAELNKLPGAPIVAYIIATLDCPKPPVVDEKLDWVKDFEVPWCGNTFDITMPRIENPFGWLPGIKDLPKQLFLIAKYVLQQTMLKIIAMIMTKICEILGNAACSALGAAGASLAALASGGRTQITDAIRDSICGDDVDPEVVDDTVVDMFADLGVGAAALADTAQVLDFAGDISSAVTTDELYNAFLCDPSQEFLTVVSQLIKYEYTDFQSALNNEDAIKSFFCNMGNLMPEDFKQQMQDLLDSLPEDLPQQAASLCACATPEQIEEFCDLRSQILANRATPTQIQQLCDTSLPVEDLKDLADALQNGIPGPGQIMSDPGCDNGIFPSDLEEITATATAALNDQLEMLKVDFTTDMLGNGPTKKKWGMINMILSDTMGIPLTAHYRKSFNQRSYVDFYMDPDDFAAYMDAQEPDDGASAFTDIAAMTKSALSTALIPPPLNSMKALAKELFPNPPKLKRQKGAFPTKIADWLQDYMKEELLVVATPNQITFNSNNDFQSSAEETKSLDEAGVETFGSGINFLRLDDDILGYNTTFKVEGDNIVFVEQARKLTPDTTFHFEDNCKGLHGDTSTYSTAFDVELYLGELTSPDGTENEAHNLGNSVTTSRGVTYTSPLDATRIKIVENPNVLANTYTKLAAQVPDTLKDVKIKLIPDNTGVSLNESLVNWEALALAESDSFFPMPKLVMHEQVKYEFLSVDNTLSGIDFDLYPNFVQTFNSYQPYTPQVVLLHELMQSNGYDLTIEALASTHETYMESLTKLFMAEVAYNEDSFIYGAEFDDLSYKDVEYVIGEEIANAWIDGTDGESRAVAGTLYYQVRLPLESDAPDWMISLSNTFWDGGRPIMNKDQILGVSGMQFRLGPTAALQEANRVFFLDPLTYGGNYLMPPLHIKPLQNKGWLGFVDVMFPELSPCKPYSTDIIDFEDIQKKITDAYPLIPEDQRLKDDSDCAVEMPYNRILDRAAVAGMEGIITAAIRIYASSNFIKSMSTFTKFNPSFPDVFSNLYAQYVIEDMKKSFKDPSGFFQGPFKDTQFWYAFLEQSVQLYGRRVDNGDILDPPADVLSALARLNDLQEKYDYPDREELKEERGEMAGLFETLKGYRKDKNYEAIQATEGDAKLILKELVVEQLNYMGAKFTENLKIIGMTPDIYDLDYYILQYLSDGGTDLTLNEELVRTYVGLATEGEEIYTTGGELALSDGSEYVGYYHVAVDDDGNPMYMVGEFHIEEAHDILTPMANHVEVNIGDIASYGVDVVGALVSTSFASGGDVGVYGTKPFVIEKYIRINGGSPQAPGDSTSGAIGEIMSNDPSLNISDVYPGTLELVTDVNGQVVGLTGELGVRYGLRFSLNVDGAKKTITEVEVDSLDLKISQVDPFDGNSLLLLCLINMLKKDDKFRMVAHYIFPLSKLTATTAIYNGEAFLPSIGEKVVDLFAVDGDDLVTDVDAASAKPGVALEFDEEAPSAEVAFEYVNNDGWAAKADRDPGFGAGMFVLRWDEWDQILLRNSKTRIKKMFKGYYNSRTWSPGEEDGSFGGPGSRPGVIVTKEFREKYTPAPGQDLLPWWRYRMMRTNPFNASGELCENDD